MIVCFNEYQRHEHNLILIYVTENSQHVTALYMFNV